MSAVISVILAILQKHTNISVKVTMESSKNGGSLLTNISLKEATIPAETPKHRRKKKNPSKVMRDKKRHEAYLSRKAGSCDKHSAAAAPPSHPNTHHINPIDNRRIVIPVRCLDPCGSGNGDKKDVWQPSMVPEKGRRLLSANYENCGWTKSKL